MAAQIVDGKLLAQTIRTQIAEEATNLHHHTGIRPGLAVFLVGNDPASAVYVRNKKKACDAAGFHVHDYKLDADTNQTELLGLIDAANHDPSIHGILVQLPLPPQIDSRAVLEAVSPLKDADGFHPYNVGRLLSGDPVFLPCTPKGVMKMIESTGQPIQGTRAVVLGRSNIVGKPIAALLMQANATVTICHSKTHDLPLLTREADILIAAIGKAQFITRDMVKDGAIVMDVGINRLDDGRLVGDVDFESVREQAGWLSPVPGGVGPMTIAMLLSNTLEAAKRTAGQ